MKKPKQENFTSCLLAAKTDLEDSLRNREAIRAAATPEIMDSTTIIAAQETRAEELNRATATLKEVTEALERIKNGDFGTCARCHEEIPLKRLRAVPFALCCVSCGATEKNPKKKVVIPNQSAFRASELPSKPRRKSHVFDNISNFGRIRSITIPPLRA